MRRFEKAFLAQAQCRKQGRGCDMKSKSLGWLAVGLLLLPISSQATLLARDAAGNQVLWTDPSRTFIYDTDLDITWLANWNANGEMEWQAANTWAANLSYPVGASLIDDWRLPSIVDTGVPGCEEYAYGGTDCGYNVQTASGSTVYSEMAHLWYVTLGNKAPYDTSGAPQTDGGLINTGPFLNMQAFDYWSGTEYAPYPDDPDYIEDSAWIFSTAEGNQNDALKEGNVMYAVAVRSGDVAPVPLPAAAWLLLSGLGGLGFFGRRKAA